MKLPPVPSHTPPPFSPPSTAWSSPQVVARVAPMGAARPRARVGEGEGCPDRAPGAADARRSRTPPLPVLGRCRALLLRSFSVAALLLLAASWLPAVDATLSTNDMTAMTALKNAWCVGGRVGECPSSRYWQPKQAYLLPI